MDTKQYSNPESRKLAKRITRHPEYQKLAERCRQLAERCRQLTKQNKSLTMDVESLRGLLEEAETKVKQFEAAMKESAPTLAEYQVDFAECKTFGELFEKLGLPDKDKQASSSQA